MGKRGGGLLPPSHFWPWRVGFFLRFEGGGVFVSLAVYSFIIQYYKTLAENPAALHKFYSGHSVFKHSLVEGAPTVSGEDINAQITELYGDKHVDIVLENGEVDCQQGKDGAWAAHAPFLFYV